VIVETVADLSETDVEAVRRLVADAAAHDGVTPLNEHTLLHLTGRHGDERHLLARAEDGSVAGYAHLDDDGSAEVVVAPRSRRQGVGTALVRALAGSERPLKVWAHGKVPGATAFADRLGFETVRELYVLRRDAGTAPPLAEAAWPDGFAVRTFRPGQDDEAWLALNARAFADHPEQGRWTRDDLAERLAQPWFDPDGFFLVIDIAADRPAGFHWTKVHPGPPPHGEVYVVGVDPDYQGTKLGKLLTIIGVRHLHGRGLDQVILYVDGANAAARTMYERLGFAEASVDVQFAAGSDVDHTAS
jgi:mycothiol synthase